MAPPRGQGQAKKPGRPRKTAKATPAPAPEEGAQDRGTVEHVNLDRDDDNTSVAADGLRSPLLEDEPKKAEPVVEAPKKSDLVKAIEEDNLEGMIEELVDKQVQAKLEDAGSVAPARPGIPDSIKAGRLPLDADATRGLSLTRVKEFVGGDPDNRIAGYSLRSETNTDQEPIEGTHWLMVANNDGSKAAFKVDMDWVEGTIAEGQAKEHRRNLEKEKMRIKAQKAVEAELEDAE